MGETMVLNCIIEDSGAIAKKNSEDTITMSKVSDFIGQEYKKVCSPIADLETHYGKILSQTTLSLRRMANSFNRTSEYLEVSDVEHIKDALNKYASNDDRVKAFKNVIIDDLTDFQKQIRANHIKKMADYNGKRQLCEKQIAHIVAEKKQLTPGFLNIFGADAKKIKECDSKINALKSQLQQHINKVVIVQQSPPIADEKDILIYQMQLKDKYGKKRAWRVGEAA